jgi:hypothetical protein
MPTSSSHGAELLSAQRHPLVPELVIVSTDALEWSDGNVVARFNEKHGVLGRTKHAGPKPSLAAIRAAITTCAPAEADGGAS